MSDQAKLDMAIKYSTNAYINKLNYAIEEWEKATLLIMSREKLMYDLENFERTASDPNRFFQKEKNLRNSKHRLTEAVQRNNLYKQIDDLEASLDLILTKIGKELNDNITYKNRLYRDKMKWDRIEMLYMLNEERRNMFIKHDESMMIINTK